MQCQEILTYFLFQICYSLAIEESIAENVTSPRDRIAFSTGLNVTIYTIGPHDSPFVVVENLLLGNRKVSHNTTTSSFDRQGKLCSESVFLESTTELRMVLVHYERR